MISKQGQRLCFGVLAALLVALVFGGILWYRWCACVTEGFEDNKGQVLAMNQDYAATSYSRITGPDRVYRPYVLNARQPNVKALNVKGDNSLTQLGNTGVVKGAIGGQWIVLPVPKGWTPQKTPSGKDSGIEYVFDIPGFVPRAQIECMIYSEGRSTDELFVQMDDGPVRLWSPGKNAGKIVPASGKPTWKMLVRADLQKGRHTVRLFRKDAVGICGIRIQGAVEPGQVLELGVEHPATDYYRSTGRKIFEGKRGVSYVPHVFDAKRPNGDVYKGRPKNKLELSDLPIGWLSDKTFYQQCVGERWIALPPPVDRPDTKAIPTEDSIGLEYVFDLPTQVTNGSLSFLFYTVNGDSDSIFVMLDGTWLEKPSSWQSWVKTQRWIEWSKDMTWEAGRHVLRLYRREPIGIGGIRIEGTPSTPEPELELELQTADVQLEMPNKPPPELEPKLQTVEVQSEMPNEPPQRPVPANAPVTETLPNYTTEVDFTYDGNDLESTALQTSPEDCAVQCDQRTTCVGFTYGKLGDSYGSCYLKSRGSRMGRSDAYGRRQDPGFNAYTKMMQLPRSLDELLGGATQSGVYQMVHPLDENKDLSVYVQLLPVAGRVQKWALILNYRHRGGTNPNTKAMFDLPLLGTELDLTRPDAIDSGVDESNTPFWGHAHPVLLRKMDFDAIRFSGISSNRSEWPLALNFSVTDGRVIGYVKAGGLAGLDTTFQLDAIRNAQLLPGHTSDDLPRFADKGWRLRDIGDEANMLLAFPFYKGGDAHWSIRGQGRRWEVSDYEPTERFHTHHQVWIGLQKYLN